MLRVLITLVAFCGPAFGQNAAPFASYHSASEPVLNDPHDLAFGPDGMLYIADKFANRVAVMDPDTLELVGSVGEGEVPGAHDVSFGPDGTLHVAATSFSAVVSYDLSGETAVREGSLGPFAGTEGVLAHSNGLLYVMASGTGDLFVVADRENLLASTSGMQGAHDVAEAPDGTIWVADNFQRRLIQFSDELEQLQILSGPEYGFRGPRYLDFNLDGAMIVADQDAHRVMKIDPASGKVLGVIGSGMPGLGPNLFDDPEGVAVRGSEYYFADSDNNRIVKYIVALN